MGEPQLWRGCPPEPTSLSIPPLAPWPHADPGAPALPPQPLASSTLLWDGDELWEGAQSQAVGRRMGVPPCPLPANSPSPSPPQRLGLGGSPSCPQPQGCSRVLGAQGAGHRAPLLHDGLGLGVGCDSSGDSERFLSAVETLEPSEAGEGLEAAGGLGKAPIPAGAAPQELPPASPSNAKQVQGEDLGGGLRAAPWCEDGSDMGDVGELLVQLQGCSLQSSSPHTPGPFCSPTRLTSWDQEPLSYCHVTPRSKSRLQASAARLSTSSSSSLFGKDTLEMPRRPPRLRAPRGVPRDPPIPLGPCTTSQGEDVSSRDTEGTGSLDDTEILPRVPSQASLTPGTSSSPGSSPTVLLVPGDHGHPHDSPSDTWASPHATVSLRALEGGSEWQNPLSLGTHQPNWPQGSFSHLQAPQPPGSTAVEPGSPAVPFSPAAHSTRCPQEHLEDEQQGQLPFEQHSPGTEATSSPEDARLQAGWACSVPARPLSDEGLRRRLRALGHEPGPVTELTRRLYQRRLQELERGSRPRRAVSWGCRCSLVPRG
ncbi:ankyrin repeat and LEM domain-containing protein 1 isoform X1 [Colius striatus]|uniref:ankyrin repeat and LEM domain-containing protein 1 isoform X1 n=1 Tax=Colius striatus TaxID=57412 RepID=UPI002B1DFFFB|nr:ankyrin repeat and LEM domain-containing protein 1 isoform X1 [Colius striatus]